MMASNDRREPYGSPKYGQDSFAPDRAFDFNVDTRRGSERPTSTLRPGQLDYQQQEGEILAGRYRVQQCLGRTGNEIVVIARHLELGQRVLVRYLSPLAMEIPEVVLSFQRAARKAFELRSEHAERVLDFGRLDSGSPFRVAELPRGPSAEEVLAVRGPLPVEEAVDMVIMACEAVAEAHAARLLYRNLGCTNLFVERRSDGSPLVKLVDFGVLDALADDVLGGYELAVPGASSMTQSLRYVAPEQIRNPAGVDYRANIWGLGGILYELLAGRSAFQADSSVALLAMIAADTPEPLDALRPDLPYEIVDLVRACLSKDPALRPQSVAAVVDALAPFASPEIQVAAVRIGRVVPSTAPPPSRRGHESSFAPPAEAPGFSSRNSDRYFVRNSERTPYERASAAAPPPVAHPSMPVASMPAGSMPVGRNTTRAAGSQLQSPAAHVWFVAVGGLIGVVAATVVALALRGQGDSSANAEPERVPYSAALGQALPPGAAEGAPVVPGGPAQALAPANDSAAAVGSAMGVNPPPRPASVERASTWKPKPKKSSPDEARSANQSAPDPKPQEADDAPAEPKEEPKAEELFGGVD